MIAFLDSSVVARVLLGEPDPLDRWAEIGEAYAARLMAIEIARLIDRLRLGGAIDDEAVVHLHAEARRLLRSIDLVELSEPILERAAGPMPTVLRTLDALHLATAMELKRDLEQDLVLATHDSQLARAARAAGFEVVGV